MYAGHFATCHAASQAAGSGRLAYRIPQDGAHTILQDGAQEAHEDRPGWLGYHEPALATSRSVRGGRCPWDPKGSYRMAHFPVAKGVAMTSRNFWPQEGRRGESSSSQQQPPSPQPPAGAGPVPASMVPHVRPGLLP